MKYCKNCGAQLEDKAMFCDNCGAKVEEKEDSDRKQDSMKKQQKKKKNSSRMKWIVIVAVGALVLCLAEYFIFHHIFSAPEEKKQVTSSEKIQWEDNMEKVDELKKRPMKDYPDVTVEFAVSNAYSVNEWKYGKRDNTEYLQCRYVSEGGECRVIFENDEQGFAEITGYFVDGVKQEEEALAQFQKTILDEKLFSSKRIGFFSNGKWGMEITAIDPQQKIITYSPYWWNFETSQMEQAGEAQKTIRIVNENAMGDENREILWKGNDSFSMEQYDCEILFPDGTQIQREKKEAGFWESGTGEFTRMDKPENIVVSGQNLAEVQMNLVEATPEPTAPPVTEAPPAPTQVPENEPVEFPEDVPEEYMGRFIEHVPAEGIFWESAPLYSKFYVEVLNTTDYSFDFKIYQAKSVEKDGTMSNHQLVFKQHTAVFTGPYRAVYEGKNYTLVFETNPDPGYLTLVNGFSEVIPDGTKMMNTDYLQVS